MADGTRDDVEHHGQREYEAQHPANHHQDHFEPVERSPFQVMLPLQHQFVRDGHSSLFPSSWIKLSSSRRNAGTHNHRRLLFAKGGYLTAPLRSQGVWVPAFAGTTPRNSRDARPS